MSHIDRDMIKTILMDLEDSAIRFLFVEKYTVKLEEFLDHMADAFAEWQELDALIAKDPPGAHVSALLYGAFHTHVVAMKLLISGLFVPAGNSQRYVLESIATALLVSKPDLSFLKRYMENQYSTTKAVRDVLRNADTLCLAKKPLEMLQQQSKHYDLSSHPTIFSAASLITLNTENSAIVLGGHFDEGKVFAYDKEITSRVSLASIFTNILYGVRRNYCGTE